MKYDEFFDGWVSGIILQVFQGLSKVIQLLAIIVRSLYNNYSSEKLDRKMVLE